MKQHSAAPPRLTLSIEASDRRALVETAARRSIREGRPVSVAEVALAAIRLGLEHKPEVQAA